MFKKLLGVLITWFWVFIPAFSISSIFSSEHIPLFCLFEKCLDWWERCMRIPGLSPWSYSLQLSLGRRNLLTALHYHRDSVSGMARAPWVSWQVTRCLRVLPRMQGPVFCTADLRVADPSVDSSLVVGSRERRSPVPTLVTVYLASLEPCLINQPAFLLRGGNIFLHSLTQTLGFM